MTEPQEYTIDRLGHLGDGIAVTEQGDVYIPYTLPGERVLITPPKGEGTGKLSILKPSDDRVTPPCKHFKKCGGCNSQHMSPSFYKKWKESLVQTVLDAENLTTELKPLISAGSKNRRRASFAATRTKRGAQLGFYGKATHNIIPLEECHILAPEIVRAFTAIANLVGPGLSRKGRASVAVTATETGLDIAVEGGKADPDLAMRQVLAEWADKTDIARLTWDGDMISERRLPVLTHAGIPTPLPPGGFLQASAASEKIMVDLVLEAVGSARNVADLFAGSGTFTFALSKFAKTLAVEHDEPALAALERAFNREGPSHNLKTVTLEKRNLFRRPLLPHELKNFDAVVFDPPRAGAKAQAAELAKSTVPIVVGVSCNPATFVRDASLLVAGGYELVSVTPIDQFIWSPHIEVVGVFKRP